MVVYPENDSYNLRQLRGKLVLGFLGPKEDQVVGRGRSPKVSKWDGLVFVFRAHGPLGKCNCHRGGLNTLWAREI